MLEKVQDACHRIAGGRLPRQAANTATQARPGCLNAPRLLGQEPGRVSGWRTSAAHSQVRCLTGTKSSARFAFRPATQKKGSATGHDKAGDTCGSSGQQTGAVVDGRRKDEFDEVLAMVSRHCGVPKRLLLHRSRCRSPIARARQLAMYLMNTSLGRTMTDIGVFFRRDRTTVAYACGRVEDWRDDQTFDEEVAMLETEISKLHETAAAAGRSHG